MNPTAGTVSPVLCTANVYGSSSVSSLSMLAVPSYGSLPRTSETDTAPPFPVPLGAGYLNTSGR